MVYNINVIIELIVKEKFVNNSNIPKNLFE